MRILVVSDTHGDLRTLMKAVNAQPSAEIIVHCGDGDEQDGVGGDRDVGPVHGPDESFADHSNGPVHNRLRVVDDCTGLAARHQRAVRLVGAIDDSDNSDRQAAL